MSNKRELWALNVSSCNAGDYFSGKSCNYFTEMYLFATSDEAKDFAMQLDTDSETYIECMLFHGELTDEEILEVSGFEAIEDFDEAMNEPYSTNWNRKNYGEDEKKAVASYIMEEYNNTQEDIPCANYDFNKSIEGAIIVLWSWHQYIGYAREFTELRYATYDETEALLTKEDRVSAVQVDIVMTAEEVANCEDLRAELDKRLIGNRDTWKWTKPGIVGCAITELS